MRRTGGSRLGTKVKLRVSDCSLGGDRRLSNKRMQPTASTLMVDFRYNHTSIAGADTPAAMQKWFFSEIDG